MKHSAVRLLACALLAPGWLLIQAAQFGDLNYAAGTTSVAITGYTGAGGDVTIPNTINGLPVINIDDRAFQESKVTSVTIPDSVIRIGFGAFARCENLSSVVIPKSVTNIGGSVFISCTALAALDVSPLNPVYSSLDGVLFDKDQLSLIQCPGKTGSYTIPDSVISVGAAAFSGSSVTSVVMPNSVTSIGEQAFFDCTNLITVVIPNRVASIGLLAFAGCTSLTSIAIPDSVTQIKAGTFSNCAGLTSVTLGSGVTNIVTLTGFFPKAFYNCTSLTTIEVSPLNPAYSSMNGVLFDTTHSTLLICPEGKTAAYTIPESVTNIAGNAFESCINLTNVTIPESVTSIGGRAFSDCTNLTDVLIPNSVTSIEHGAFARCRSLTSVIIPAGVTSVEPSTFNGCTSLTNVRIPDSITTVGIAAFLGSGLTRVMIPDSVTNIGASAFAYCPNLTSVYCKGHPPALGEGVFSDTTDATVYYLPATASWGPSYAERPTAMWIPITPTPLTLAVDNPLRLVTHSPAPATVRVQRSTNFVDWEDWQTVSRDAGPSELHDTDAGTAPYRFYRGIEE